MDKPKNVESERGAVVASILIVFCAGILLFGA